MSDQPAPKFQNLKGFELFEQRFQQLDQQLQNTGPVKQAFERLCERGHDPEELRRQLERLTNIPWERTKRSYTSADARKLASIARQIESSAKRFQSVDSEHLMVLSLLGADLSSDFVTLMSMASSIRKAIQVARAINIVSYTANEALVFLVETTKDRTGKPHFAELATLVGAAYQLPHFSEDELKMRFHREIKRQRQLVARMRATSDANHTPAPV